MVRRGAGHRSAPVSSPSNISHFACTLSIILSQQQLAELKTEVDERKTRHSRARVQFELYPNNRTSKPKQQASWVYKHMPDVDAETRHYDDNGKLEWRCQYCSKTYALSGGTAVIMDHLCHPPSEESRSLERHDDRDAQAKNPQTTIQCTLCAIGS
jgi:hypothetical protein